MLRLTRGSTWPRLDNDQGTDVSSHARTTGIEQNSILPITDDVDAQATAAIEFDQLNSSIDEDGAVTGGPTADVQPLLRSEDQQATLGDLDNHSPGSLHSIGLRESPTSPRSEADPVEQQEHFEPIRVPAGYQPLDYLPTTLTSKVTITLAIFYCTVGTSIGMLYWRSQRQQGYLMDNLYIYLAAHFGPAVVAAITTTLFKNTLQELGRMLPYINMADLKYRMTARPGKVSLAACYWPMMAPNSFRTWTIQLLGILTGPLIAYKTLLFQITEHEGHWLAVVHGNIALLLVIYYSILTIFTLLLTVKLWSRQTGLRRDWDSRSLSDMLALFYWRNFRLETLAMDEGKEIFPNFRQVMDPIVFRLGYWRRTYQAQGQIVYGIRSIGKYGAVRDYMVNKDQSRYSVGRRRPAAYPYLHSPVIGIYFYIQFAVTICSLIYLLYLGAAGYVANG